MKEIQIKKDKAVAVAIDFQERLLPVMADAEALEQTVVKMIEGLRVLNVDILVTQQYTKGLGETTAPIREALGEFTPIEKTTFSSMRTPEFYTQLENSGAKTVLLFGIEAHICVQQTAMDLVRAGYDVFLIEDCCSSRKENEKQVSLNRMANSNIKLTTYESCLFELVGGAKEVGFKEISKIVK